MRVTLENGERQILLARLGLPETTSDSDLATAASQRLLAEPPPAPTPPAPTPDPVAGPPAPDPDPSPDPAPDPLLEDDGVMVVDVAAFQGLNRRASMASRLEEEQRVIERDALIEGAVRVGKFPPGRRVHYATRYDSDPEATRRDIDRMAANVVPIHERGKDVQEEELEAQSDAYPKEWVTSSHGPKSPTNDRTASRVHGEE